MTMPEQQLLDLAVLLKELYYFLKKYETSPYGSRQVENILAIIYEEDNPKRYSEIYSCLKQLYFPKAGLSEFYVSSSRSSNWRELNQRLSEIHKELDVYEQKFERYR